MKKSKSMAIKSFQVVNCFFWIGSQQNQIRASTLEFIWTWHDMMTVFLIRPILNVYRHLRGCLRATTGQCLRTGRLAAEKASQCKASLTHQLREESFQGELSSFLVVDHCFNLHKKIFLEWIKWWLLQPFFRAFEQIFESIDTSENMKYLVHASYLEIYNEEIRSGWQDLWQYSQ